MQRPVDADEEWALLEPELEVSERRPREPSRGGRPRSRPAEYGWIDDQTIRTSSGITIRRASDGRAHILRLEGAALNSDLIESLMLEIQALLEK